MIPAALLASLSEAKAPTQARHISETLDEIIARASAFLTAYQNAAYAARYRELVNRVQAKEAEVLPGQHALTETVARYLFKLMAYKDEYEVARLYADGSFQKQVEATFEPTSASGQKLRYEFNLAPPLLAKRRSQSRYRRAR
jgi:indolepyruvate ferredoxin oxidoreductase